MSSVAEAFASPPAPPIICKVCDILPMLDGEGRANVEAALAAPPKVWPHAIIAAKLTGLGFRVSEHPVKRHRERCL